MFMYYRSAFQDLSLGTKNIEIGGILAKILTITLPLPYFYRSSSCTGPYFTK